MITSIRLTNLTASGGLKNRREVETYLVITDAAETIRTIFDNESEDLPKRGDYNDDETLVVSDLSVDRHPDSAAAKQVFRYTVTWSTPEFSVEFTEAPWDRAPDISWEGTDETEITLVDANGVAYRNSAGDIPANIPERIAAGAAVSITRNEELSPASRIAIYSNTVSANAWMGVAELCSRMGKITSQKIYEGGYTFWRTTYPIAFKRDTWRYKAIDAGFNTKSGTEKRKIGTYLLDATTGLKKFVEKETISFLDGSGAELGPSAAPVVYPTDGYAQMEEIDWTDLDLPDPFAD